MCIRDSFEPSAEAVLDRLLPAYVRTTLYHALIDSAAAEQGARRNACLLYTSISQRDVLVVDPMLATGGSATAAIHYLRKQGVENIKLVVLVAAPAGIEAVLASDPDVQIYTCAIDECLNEHAYIVPGLGDAGDRIFGTK